MQSLISNGLIGERKRREGETIKAGVVDRGVFLDLLSPLWVLLFPRHDSENGME